MQKNQLFEAPPYAVEKALLRLGADLKTARLRRNLTIQEVAEKIGTGIRAVSDAEKGKITTSIGIYAALLWVMGLLEQLDDVAKPTNDLEGQTLISLRDKERARHSGDLDSDF